MLVAHDLHFDVPGPAHQLLQEDLVAAEGGLRLALAGGDLLDQSVLAFDGAHAAAAAAPARLEHHGVADLRRDAPHLGLVVGQDATRRHHRNVGRLGQRARLHLAAETPHHGGRRADEGDAAQRAGLGQLRVLGQEAVAGMHRIGTAVARDADHLLDVQVGLHRLLPLADQVGLVGLETMQREAILVGIEGDGTDAELARRPQHADGDLAAVGHQQLAKHPQITALGGPAHRSTPPICCAAKCAR